MTIKPLPHELKPEVWGYGHCALCEKCWVNRLTQKCECGGPFNKNHYYDPSAWVPKEKKEWGKP